MSDDPIAYLLARLDEEDVDAKAASEESGPDWDPGDEHLSEAVSERESGAAVVMGTYGYLDWAVRRHIARHDPASVLTRVKTNRQIIKTCAESLTVHEESGFATVMLKMIAQPYADRDDFPEELRLPGDGA